MKRKQILTVASVIFLAFPPVARACEVSDPESQSEFDQSMRASFAEAEGLYEGIIVAKPDFAKEGMFLVLRTHKGSTKNFQLLTLPPAGGCIGTGGPSYAFAAGLLTINSGPDVGGFNGLYSKERTESLERQNLIDRIRVTWLKFGLLSLALLALLVTAALSIKRRLILANSKS